MRPLSPHEILKVWEVGLSQSPRDRALTFLAAVIPDKAEDQLANLTIAGRDALLLDLRERMFGQTLTGFAECPRCTERLEFVMTTAEIRGIPRPGPVEKEHLLEVPGEDLKLRFRMPNSLDLAALTACENMQHARSVLLKRCVVEINHSGRPVEVEDLSLDVVDRVAASMAECEPQSEVLLDLHCPACSHRWQMMFDIVAYFWQEISAEARRLMREVHALSSAYGWREEEILSLSHARRQFYLDMVTS